jgi:hypothetical protein
MRVAAQRRKTQVWLSSSCIANCGFTLIVRAASNKMAEEHCCSLQDVRDAAERIKGLAHETPVSDGSIDIYLRLVCW